MRCILFWVKTLFRSSKLQSKCGQTLVFKGLNFNYGLSFKLLFLPNPEFKSTFVQHYSCRYIFLLQLSFWPKFKFKCKTLNFSQSKSSKKDLNCVTYSPSSPYWARQRLAQSGDRPRVSHSANLLHHSERDFNLVHMYTVNVSYLEAICVFVDLHLFSLSC